MTANTNFNATISRALKSYKVIAITLHGLCIMLLQKQIQMLKLSVLVLYEVNLLATVPVLKILLPKTGRSFSVLLVGPCYEILVTTKKKS